MQHLKILIKRPDCLKPAATDRVLYLLDTQINQFVLAAAESSNDVLNLVFLTPKDNLAALGEDNVDMFDSCFKVFSTMEQAAVQAPLLKSRKDFNAEKVMVFKIVVNKASDGIAYLEPVQEF